MVSKPISPAQEAPWRDGRLIDFAARAEAATNEALKTSLVLLGDDVQVKIPIVAARKVEKIEEVDRQHHRVTQSQGAQA